MKALFILRVELLLSPNNPGPAHDSEIGAPIFFLQTGTFLIDSLLILMTCSFVICIGLRAREKILITT